MRKKSALSGLSDHVYMEAISSVPKLSELLYRGNILRHQILPPKILCFGQKFKAKCIPFTENEIPECIAARSLKIKSKMVDKVKSSLA